MHNKHLRLTHTGTPGEKRAHVSSEVPQYTHPTAMGAVLSICSAGNDSLLCQILRKFGIPDFEHSQSTSFPSRLNPRFNPSFNPSRLKPNLDKTLQKHRLQVQLGQWAALQKVGGSPCTPMGHSSQNPSCSPAVPAAFNKIAEQGKSQQAGFVLQ